MPPALLLTPLALIGREGGDLLRGELASGSEVEVRGVSDWDGVWILRGEQNVRVRVNHVRGNKVSHTRGSGPGKRLEIEKVTGTPGVESAASCLCDEMR